MHNGARLNDAPETGHLGIQDKFRAMGRLPSISTADTRLADHKEAGVLKLITTYRLRGHQAAALNPLEDGSSNVIPDLDPAWHDLDESDLEREFDSGSLDAPRRSFTRRSRRCAARRRARRHGWGICVGRFD